MTYTFKIQADTTAAQKAINDLRMSVANMMKGLKNAEKNTVKVRVAATNVADIRKQIKDTFNKPVDVKVRAVGESGRSLSNMLGGNMFGSFRNYLGAYMGYQGIQQVLHTGFERERMMNLIRSVEPDMQKSKDIQDSIIKMSTAIGVNASGMGRTFGMLSQVAGKQDALELTKRVGMVAGFSGFNPYDIGINLMQMLSAGSGFADMVDIKQLREKYPLFTKYIAKVKGVDIKTAEAGLKEGRYLTGNEAMKAFGMMTEENSELGNWFKEYQKSTLSKWDIMRVEIQNKIVSIYKYIEPYVNKLINFVFSFIDKLRQLKPALDGIMPILKDIFWYGYGAFKRIGEGVVIALNFIKEFWPYLQWIAAIFATWKIAGFVNTVIEGLAKITSGAYATAMAFHSWTAPILTAMAALLAFDAVRRMSMLDEEQHQRLMRYKEIQGQLQIKELTSPNMRTQKDITEIARLNDEKDDLLEKISEYEDKKGEGFWGYAKFALKNEIESLLGIVEKSIPGFKKPFIDWGKLQITDDKAMAGTPTTAALDTSNLYGAHGGLGEHKVINLYFSKALVENNIQNGNGKDIMMSSNQAAEFILKIVNNLGYRQSYAY